MRMGWGLDERVLFTSGGYHICISDHISDRILKMQAFIFRSYNTPASVP